MMGTRGTAILLLKDNVIISKEFDDNMFPNGYGNEFFGNFSEVRNVEEFEEILFYFNESYFKYDDDLVKKLDNEEFYCKKVKHYKHIDLFEVSKKITSDWLMLKNKSGELITLEALHGGKLKLIKIQSGQSLRFNFDSLPIR